MRFRHLRPQLTVWLVLVSQIGVSALACGAVHVDFTTTANLAGRTRSQTVEWYRRGPFAPVAPDNPPTFIRGVAVRAGGLGTAVVARWESTPTTILAFYPKLNNVWSLPGRTGAVISAAVQYGGRVVDLYVLQWESGRLKVVGQMEGENMTVMRLEERLVVEVVPDDYSRVPELFAWDGVRFNEASRTFPMFYSRLAQTYVGGVENPHPLPPTALVQSCQLAFQAFELARQPALARRACLEARERISAGRALVRGVAAESPQVFERERRDAVQRINALLMGTTAPR